jgi:hypothetical protein
MCISDFFWNILSISRCLSSGGASVSWSGWCVVIPSPVCHSPQHALFYHTTEANSQLPCILSLHHSFSHSFQLCASLTGLWVFCFIQVGFIKWCKFRGRQDPWGCMWMSQLLNAYYCVISSGLGMMPHLSSWPTLLGRCCHSQKVDMISQKAI